VLNFVAHAMVAFCRLLPVRRVALFKSRFREVIPQPTCAFTTPALDHTAVIGVRARRGAVSSTPTSAWRPFAGAVSLAALRVADHDQTIRRMPWTPILMVCGVSVLVALLEKTKGLDLFTELLSKIATPAR
jgi:di/tricarboxylate transporter